MEWKPYLPLPWKRLKLIDGTLSRRGDYVMRRKIHGVWQYRLMTPEERDEDFMLHSW